MEGRNLQAIVTIQTGKNQRSDVYRCPRDWRLSAIMTYFVFKTPPWIPRDHLKLFGLLKPLVGPLIGPPLCREAGKMWGNFWGFYEFRFRPIWDPRGGKLFSKLFSNSFAVENFRWKNSARKNASQVITILVKWLFRSFLGHFTEVFRQKLFCQKL